MKWVMAMALFAGVFLAAGETLPSGDQVIRRVVDRFAARATATNAPAWAYDKRTVMEKLDGNATVQERTEKVYRVRIVRGVPLSKLVKVEGRELTESELNNESRSEAAFQKDLSGRDAKQAVAKREPLVTTNLVDRFEFTVLRRELIQGRQTLVVSFAAKVGKEKESVPEQLLNRMAGTLWVDEATGDVARLEVHLTKAFSMGVFGILGTVRECGMKMASKPMPDGTWLPEKSEMSMSARIFLSTIRFQMVETSDGYTLESAPQPGQP